MTTKISDASLQVGLCFRLEHSPKSFSDLAARSRLSRLRLLQLATSMALLTEAAVELERSGDT